MGHVVERLSHGGVEGYKYARKRAETRSHGLDEIALLHTSFLGPHPGSFEKLRPSSPRGHSGQSHHVIRR